MRKNHPIGGKSQDTPLKEETEKHEVEHQLNQVYCKEKHKEEGEDNNIVLINGGCSN